MIKYFLHNKYDLYKLKLLLWLLVETSSLWRYVFWSLVRISIQGGSGHCVYAVSCIGASRILRNLVNNSLALATGFQPDILRSLKTVRLYRNMSELRV